MSEEAIDMSLSSRDEENQAPPADKEEVVVVSSMSSSSSKKTKRNPTTTIRDDSPRSPPRKQQATSTTKKDMESLVSELRANVDHQPVGVWSPSYSARRQLSGWSVLRKHLEEKKHDNTDWPAVLDAAMTKDAALNRAVGCFLGMVAGDSVGAPLEFSPACSTPTQDRSKQDGDAWVVFDATNKTLKYTNESNAFRLERGQWTDDASMGICMAESMLVTGGYQGGDVRVRFHLWWSFGYSNAFRHDPKRPGSVGLGGNIGQSLKDLIWNYPGKLPSQVPSRYEATGEDAGNGSLMRLAPVPIRYSTQLEQAMDMAEESSYATHPGPDAAQCCRFVAFFICKAIHRSDINDTSNIATFTNQVIAEYLQREDANHDKLVALLQSTPPSAKEACWNWKAERLPMEESLEARGDRYNGYPVSAGYFGSYCQDGLAMTLWALVHSTSFADCILKTVNLQGDSDTTAAIAGQLAGAYYGYNSLKQDPCGQRMLQDIHQWDPLYELELRALLLYRDGVQEKN